MTASTKAGIVAICLHDATVGSLADAMEEWRPRAELRSADSTRHFASLRATDRFLRHHDGGEVWLRHGTMICSEEVGRHLSFMSEAPAGWTDEFLDAASAAVAGVHADVWRLLTLPMSVACRAVVRCDERGAELAAALVAPWSARCGPMKRASAVCRLLIGRPGLVLASLMRRPPTR
ncbi:MAG: hypothetical protein ABJH68_16085 [Ilumatobacter sp.]|uniref:hypothetical protein n=1 Tax=Ilumatobacter sp. TaxID=1967498 RepID=UPI0032975EC2